MIKYHVNLFVLDIHYFEGLADDVILLAKVKKFILLTILPKGYLIKILFSFIMALRGGTSPEKMGWKRDRIDFQKVCLIIFT